MQLQHKCIVEGFPAADSQAHIHNRLLGYSVCCVSIWSPRGYANAMPDQLVAAGNSLLVLKSFTSLQHASVHCCICIQAMIGQYYMFTSLLRSPCQIS